jgi:hypothetical protein
MARPKKKGFEYFRLDTDFFYNKKIKALRRAHGPIGVLTYVNILCKVYENGYYLEVKDINDFVYNIAEEISKDKIGRTAARVRETINYLIDNEMLDGKLFERNVISGYALQRQYVVMAYKARRKIEMDVHCLVDVWEIIREIRVSAEETNVIAEETNVNTEDGTQSNSIVNKNNFTTFYLNAHTREKEKNVEKSVEKIPPTFDDVLDFMLECTDVSAERVYDEAGFFISYNRARGWDCLPNWQEKALAWAKQIKIINGG